MLERKTKTGKPQESMKGQESTPVKNVVNLYVGNQKQECALIA